MSVGVPLRQVSLADGVFGIYTQRDLGGPDELQRITALVSQVTGTALFYYWDSCVDSWYQLFEHGRMTREFETFTLTSNSWGEVDPLELIGVSRSLHNVVEEAFLWDNPAPLADNRPEWTEAKWRFPVHYRVKGTVVEHFQQSGVVVDLGDPVARGFILTTHFLDDGEMTPEMFPPVGTLIQAVVLGHSDERQKLVWLGVKPSQLGGNAEPGVAANLPRE